MYSKEAENRSCVTKAKKEGGKKKARVRCSLSLSLCDAPNRQINKALHASLMRKKKRK